MKDFFISIGIATVVTSIVICLVSIFTPKSTIELTRSYGNIVDTIRVDKISVYSVDSYNPNHSEIMFVDGTLYSYLITYSELKNILQ